MREEELPRLGAVPTPGQLHRFAQRARQAGRRVVVGALLVDEGGRIYVQRRSRTRALFPGCWDIVGGHVEEGESVLAALRREVREETGWTLTDTSMVVEMLEWQGADGVSRSEIDLLAGASGDLSRPSLEQGKHDEGRWISAGEATLLLEGRRDDDVWVHQVVTRAFDLLART